MQAELESFRRRARTEGSAPGVVVPLGRDLRRQLEELGYVDDAK
jgi:hypothetical protein